MLCFTGLVLMFRTEINAWNRGTAAGSMDMSGISGDGGGAMDALWKKADAGAQAVIAKVPQKEILNISPMSGTNQLRYRIGDKNAVAAARARMGMGGEYLIYDGATGKIIDQKVRKQQYPEIGKMLHIMHELHTRMALGRGGMIFIGIMCLVCAFSIISGMFLYGPFMRADRRTAGLGSGDRRSYWRILHQELSMVTAVWAIVLCITGAAVAGFFIANDNYNRQAAQSALQELGRDNDRSEILTPSAALAAIHAKYPDQAVLSVDYPSKFNHYKYAFYLGRPGDHNPALFLGQPAYAVLHQNGEGDKFASTPLPWYFTGITTLINLHIHNHNTIALKVLWAIWLVVLMAGMIFGLGLTILRKKPSLNKHYEAEREPIKRMTETDSAKQIWLRPVLWNICALLGLFLPLAHLPGMNTLAAIFLAVPLVSLGIVLWRR